MDRVRAQRLATSTVALLIAATALATAARAQNAPLPLALDSARVTLAGTSNIHDYSAATSTVVLKSAHLAQPAAAWDEILVPGAVDVFEVSVPAASLKSDKDGLDKNMHKALLADKHPEITFRLTKLEPGAASGTLKAIGTMQIAGRTCDLTFDLTTERQASALKVTGTTSLLMTDYGITPPKAMLGMLKTHPKVTVTFEALLSIR